jgi:hypothetical protein
MATEKRLIDANDVPELLEKEFVRKWRLVLDGETQLDNLAEGFFSAKSVIWAMPTVDAVEVVRCKDCKWCSHNTPDGFHWCDEHERGSLCDDDFCSYGERKI